MDGTAQVVVLSPDGAVLEAAQRCLAALGHVPVLARDVREARRVLSRIDADVVCVDSIVPDDEQEELWRWLSSARDRAAPALLMLCPSSARLTPTALPAHFDVRRHALVPKPIETQHLAREMSRLLAARRGRARRPALSAGPLTLDDGTHRLCFASGGALPLTPTEFRLMRCLVEHAGEFLSPEELLQEAWGYPAGTSGPELVRAHVSNLRRKLRGIGEDPQLLRTVPYRGYALVVGDA